MRGLLLCLLLIPIWAQAQKSNSDSLKLRASLAVTGLWQGGNVETIIFRASSDIRYRPWRKWVFNTKNSYVYQEFGRQKADEDILSLNFLYFNPDRKLYPFILGFASTNFRREIDLRYLLGAGFTYQILNKKDNWLKFSLSSEYEQTDFKQTSFNRTDYDGNRTISTFRATLWVNGRYKIFKEKAILTHESFIQPSLEASDNFRWRADLGLEFPVWKYLNFKINYLHTYESLVILGQAEEDTFLTFGFTVKNF